MKLKLWIIINGIILISILSCKSQDKEITSEFLIGKWGQYDSTVMENGETSTQFLPSLAIYFDLGEDGIVRNKIEVKHKIEWELNEQGNLTIGTNEKVAEYITKKLSDSTITISRMNKGKLLTYYFKKGWGK